jgi:Glycosyl hydrolase family 99
MYRRPLFRLFGIISAFTLALTLAGCSHASMDMHNTLRAQHFQAPDGGGPMMLAIYQPWFGQGNHPNVGYSSQDPNAIAKQIDEARSMGISGFVANWYGPRHEYVDKAYSTLQKVAAQKDFKVAIQYDEAVDNPGNWTDAVIVDLQYAYDSFIAGHTGLPTSSYLRYNGRPVIFIFPKTGKTDWNRVRQVTNSWPDKPLLIYKDPTDKYPNAFDGYYAWVQPGKEGWQRDGSNWGQDYLKDFYATMASKYPNKIAVGAAWPGFDDSSASWSQNRHMNARCGKTFEDSLRMFRRYYGNDHQLPFLLIVTWNDYEEGTAIEKGVARCNGDGSPRTLSAAGAK